jgi:hypothetical protein
VRPLTNNDLINRRLILVGAPSLAAFKGAPLPRSAASHVTAYDSPLLTSSVYSTPPRHDCDETGACSINRNDIGMIEYQRDGTEAIIHGLVLNRPDWVKRGWAMLDWGLTRQTPEGFFKCRGGRYHSNALFTEALARALLIQPAQQTRMRMSALKAAAEWLDHSDAEGMELNARFTHRSFILASALGQSSTLLQSKQLYNGCLRWASRGFAAQRPDGVNPELGGYDASYQMVGPLFALRYLPFCPSTRLRQKLGKMALLAVAWWVSRLRSDGQIDSTGSTRVGKEAVDGGPGKPVNYAEAIQVLVIGAKLLDRPDWLEIAAKILPSVKRQIGILP